MSTYLLCSSPVHGHVSPMLAIARHLADRGHDVTVLTGSRFRDAIEKTGAKPRSLAGAADFDDRSPEQQYPEMQQLRGLALIRFEIEHAFVRPIPDQYRALITAIQDIEPDVIVFESAFLGVLPLLLSRNAARPALAGVGVVPLIQSSIDVAPFGLGLPPMPGPVGRLRNRLLNVFVERVVFRDVQKRASGLLREIGAEPLRSLVLDLSRLPERFLQLSAAEFEYPRTDLSENVRFVGPVLPRASAEAVLPPWWDEIDGAACPVIHVTQGTIDNRDPQRLIRPTIEALARRDVLVIVSTGGRPVAGIGDLPANVRAAEFLPYDRLFPLTDVYVTNAGFGGTQFALSHGVPIVAAGDSEDKPEVAARVAWSGVGVNLGTGTPDAASIARAVDTVLAEPSYRERARCVAGAMTRCDAMASIERELDGLATASRSRARQ